MPQFDVPHFEEEGRANPINPGDRMPAKEYGLALDYLVFACVDLVFTCGNQVLLAKRPSIPGSPGGLWGQNDRRRKSDRRCPTKSI